MCFFAIPIPSLISICWNLCLVFFFLESYIFIKFWEFKKIILDISPLCILIKYFLPICSNPLISFKSALWRTEVFNIGNSWIFLRLTFGGVFQLSWLPLRPKRICPRFSSRSFIFRPMVQLIFFVMWSMGWICLPVFIFLSFSWTSDLIVLTPFVEKAVFSLLNCLGTSVENLLTICMWVPFCIVFCPIKLGVCSFISDTLSWFL